ncbi:MAG: GNAT family N-acetyltransferase [Acidimicrobiia bacterium]
MPEIVDHPESHRFLYEEDGFEAELVYRIRGDVMVLVHTGVPDELGGRGLGGRLVTAAIDRAEAEGLAVRPDCPFARGWLSTHPDVAARVTIDWPPED